MEISIDTTELKETSDLTTCHLLPCHINHEGEAAVDTYFTPYIREDSDQKDMLRNSFRGRPLQGSRVCLPEGYEGLILKEVSEPGDEQHNRTLKVSGRFESFTYWNWDRLPSKNDKILQAKDWVHVAQTLHQPISVEDPSGDQLARSPEKTAQ